MREIKFRAWNTMARRIENNVTIPSTGG